jgi:protein-S-isoprenylcysteine O-methyltransferase Ste14
MLVILFNVVAIAWPISEVILGLRTRAMRRSSAVKDRGSLLLIWLAVGAGLVAGNLIRLAGVGAIGVSPTLFLSAALGLMVAGLALRWTAILTLGRFFTTKVTVQQGQSIVRGGVYRHIRHPSYPGLLLAFLGLGLAFDNWLSLVAVFVPVLLALVHRMRVEEAVLAETVGEEYMEYCQVTRRLIPGVY